MNISFNKLKEATTKDKTKIEELKAQLNKREAEYRASVNNSIKLQDTLKKI